MSRPPLANLFAVYDENPAMREEIMQDLQRSGEFAEVWHPASGWVAAAAPLPGGEPDSEAVRNHQLAFAEGRDLLENQTGKDLNERSSEIAELADTKPDHLASLPGDFDFIRFRSAGSATIVRSCGGLVPFYIGRFGNRIAISTRLGDFVRYLPDEPRLDPLVNAIWASSWCMMPEGRTFLKGVSILGRGCFARIGRGSPEWGRYWNPRPKKISYPTPTLVREHAERLRSILIEKIERDLNPTFAIRGVYKPLSQQIQGVILKGRHYRLVCPHRHKPWAAVDQVATIPAELNRSAGNRSTPLTCSTSLSPYGLTANAVSKICPVPVNPTSTIPTSKRPIPVDYAIQFCPTVPV